MGKNCGKKVREKYMTENGRTREIELLIGTVFCNPNIMLKKTRRTFKIKKNCIGLFPTGSKSFAMFFLKTMCKN